MSSILIYHNNQTPTDHFISKLTSGHFTEINLKSKTHIEIYNQKHLNAFIKEENIHDALIFDSNQSIKTMSGGEQKKAMLLYLLNQKPEVLILDNPFDHLDVDSQKQLSEQLESIAKDTQIILLTTRLADIPEFISRRFVLENEQLYSLDNKGFKAPNLSNIQIPPPYKTMNFEGDTLIQLKNVSVSYLDKPILKDISWSIKPGEFWQLIGPNGSGKTTILDMITGDNVKGYGQDLYVFGHKKGSGETVWEIKQKLGYFTSGMTQQFSGQHLIKDMILGGFYDAVGLYNQATDLQHHIADQWLAVLGMKHQADKKFMQVSLGMQRMIMIARAMVKHPLLLILDEPTTGLDDDNAHLLVNFINKISKESHTTILYVSHREEEGLQPDFHYVLKPSPEGSTGHVEKANQT